MKTRYIVEDALFDAVKKLREESETQARNLREINLRVTKMSREIEDLKQWATTLPKFLE